MLVKCLVFVGCKKSNAPFSIEVVKVTSPNDGSLAPGDPLTITWTTNATAGEIAKVKLLYTKNNGRTWRLIKKVLGNPASYPWQVPTVSKAKSKCKVKVKLLDQQGNSLGVDTSDGYFSITP
jgi:hypothetical protein